MIKTPVHAATELDDEDDITYTGEIYDEDGNSICIAELDLVDDIIKRINLHEKLMQTLCDIQQMCIGEIAMGYRLNAEVIGKIITGATGLTAPELLEQCK